MKTKDFETLADGRVEREVVRKWKAAGEIDGRRLHMAAADAFEPKNGLDRDARHHRRDTRVS